MTATQVPNLDSRVPSGPPRSADEAGWDYHLIIKGFSCSNRPGAVGFSVGEFLWKLFANQSVIPVKYGYHRVIENSGGQTGRTLKLSLAVEDGVSMSLDAALRSFCGRFFETAERGAYDMLSSFGLFGFSPEEDKMKYFWYEAMFKWMNSHRATKLADLEANLAAMQNSGTLSSWMPGWTGGLVFALSLGLTWGFTKYFGAPHLQAVRLEGMDIVNTLLLKAASENEKQGDNHAEHARIHSKEVISLMDRVVGVLNEQPTAERPQMKIHWESTVLLIGLFETGYRTVTICTEAVRAFQTARQANVMAGIGALMRTAASSLNGMMLLDAAERVAVPKSTAMFSALDVAVSVGQVAYAGVKIYENEKKRRKWALVGLHVATSMKLAQGCEYYLRWTYDSGAPNGQHSPQYYNELRTLMTQLNGSEPRPEDCTPEAVRARLLGYAATLNEQRVKLEREL